MFAMELASPSRVGSTDRPLHGVHARDPEPQADELLLRVSACAVCRTDLQLCEGDLPAHKLPIVPGHQLVGRVEALGPGVSGWRVGDRAGVAWLGGGRATAPQ